MLRSMMQVSTFGGHLSGSPPKSSRAIKPHMCPIWSYSAHRIHPIEPRSFKHNSLIEQTTNPELAIVSEYQTDSPHKAEDHFQDSIRTTF